MNPTPCPLSLQKSFQRPQLTFDIVPATPEALAELDAELRNWYSMYLEFRYFKQKVKMYLDSGIFLKGQMYFGMNVPNPMKAKTKKMVEPKLAMNSLLLRRRLRAGKNASLLFSELSPLSSFEKAFCENPFFGSCLPPLFLCFLCWHRSRSWATAEMKTWSRKFERIFKKPPERR